MACKSTWTFSKGEELMWWNNVETKPYGGYPRNWDIKILELLHKIHQREEIASTWEKGVYQGLTIFEAALKEFGSGGPLRVLGYLPEEDEWKYPNIYEDTPFATESSHKDGSTLPEHSSWFFYLPRLCNHCSFPACLAACPRKAIYKRKEDGIVLIDLTRCRGYRKCIEACPYKKPMFRPTTKTSEKCIGCYPRIEGKGKPKDDRYYNLPVETRCMAACIGKVRLQGIVELNEDGEWKRDPEHPLYYLVKEERVALPLYPQLGTLPNGYYIPPRWVPRGYLRQMFGPGVEEAIKKISSPSRKLLAVMQLFRVTQEIIFKFKIINNDTVLGYGKDGKEVARVGIEEPFYLRDSHYYNSV